MALLASLTRLTSCVSRSATKSFGANRPGKSLVRSFASQRSIASQVQMVKAESVREAVPTTSKATLPFDMLSKAGFLPPTVIGESSIHNAGLGRFVAAPVKKGWVIRADPIVSVSSFVVGGGVNKDMTVAIQLRSVADIEDLNAFWSLNATDSEAATMREKMSWYMASVPHYRTDTGKGFSYILAHSFITNHNSIPNMETQVQDGMLYHKALQDLDAGTELLLDYTSMAVEPFVKDWCTRYDLTDVGTLADELSK